MRIESMIRDLPALLAAVFVSVLFIQSGSDKVFDWKGNLEWLTGHFSKTFMAGMVPLLLGTVTAMELATGFVTAAGIVYYLVSGSLYFIFWGAVLGTISVLSLFFGQRIAKDYAGAAVLVPYFLVLLAMMYLTLPVASR